MSSFLRRFFGRKLEDQERQEFTDFETRSSAAAAEALFARALPFVPVTPMADVEEVFRGIKRAWGSERLHLGSLEESHALVLRNLMRITSYEEFAYFLVSVLKEGEEIAPGVTQKASAQVYCHFDTYFVGIRIWRLGTDQFAVCGNSKFQE